MDSYYANQATSLPHFSGHYRQRGSGFGALAAGIGRVALPLARRFILPTAKRIGKELLKQSVPEILDVVGSKKSPKQAFKNTIAETVKSRLGDLDEILHVGGSQVESSHRKRSTNAKKPFQRTELQKEVGQIFLPE